MFSVSRNFFRVWEGESSGYQLVVSNGNKKQWIDAIRTARKTYEKNKKTAELEKIADDEGICNSPKHPNSLDIPDENIG